VSESDPLLTHTIVDMPATTRRPAAPVAPAQSPSAASSSPTSALSPAKTFRIDENQHAIGTTTAIGQCAECGACDRMLQRWI
jgi:ferredoxin-like protein FixX